MAIAVGSCSSIIPALPSSGGSSSSTLAFTPSSSTWRQARLKSAISTPSQQRSAIPARGLAFDVAGSDAIEIVDDRAFKILVLESEIPVLVDFWAPWYEPCQNLNPVINSIAEKYEGKIKCFKVNTDECRETAKEHRIQSIPTCMIFKQGEKVGTVIGCGQDTRITAAVDKYIS